MTRSVHAAVRDLVAGFIDSDGIEATVKRTYARPSDSLGDDVLDPDLSLDGVDLKVTSRLRPHRLSEDLDAATRAAQIRGVSVGAVVQWRQDRPIAESYIVLDLQSFTRLLRGDHKPPP